MITVRDIVFMNLDGMEFIAGSGGLDRIVSWTYVVMTRPFDDHMNPGDFTLCGVEFERFDWKEVCKVMNELNDLGISGFAVSILDDREPVPKCILDEAERLNLPLFRIRWCNASFVDIAQSIGNRIIDEKTRANQKGEFLYNLLFGYDINSRYIQKIATVFQIDFSVPHRIGVIVVDRTYTENLENDEHLYNYYMSMLEKKIADMGEATLYLNFMNKGVLLFPDYEDDRIVHKIEKSLADLDDDKQFMGRINSTCILGKPYIDPADYCKSYYEAKGLISRKDIFVSSTRRKLISMGSMGMYKFLFDNGNAEEVSRYVEKRLRKLEEYDSANNTDLINTFLKYYLNGFNSCKTANALFIHRNTMQYRLSKITELLDIDLEDRMAALDLINCIMIKRLLLE